MAIRYTRAGGGDLGGRSYFNMAREMKVIIEDELTEAGRDGAKEAQKKLDASGTGKSWSPGPWGAGGTGDRVDTDAMRDALEYRITRGVHVGLDVGWVNYWEDYFRYQDEGFSATGFRRPARAGDVVKGMGVIAHMKGYMRDSVDEAMDRAMRRITDGL